MSAGAYRAAATLLVLLACTGATMAMDLEVVVHDGATDGPGLRNLDLLLCKGAFSGSTLRSGRSSVSPCTAVATTDARGRALFEGVDAGEVFVRALTIGCGPFEWPVTVGSSGAPQKIDVVVPATGMLTVRLERVDKDGKAFPLADSRVEFQLKAQADQPAFPRLSSTGTATDSKGFARLCLPAEVEFEVTVRAHGYQDGALPRQQLKPGETATAQIVLRAR